MVKLIDFAHVLHSFGNRDDNYLFGLENLMKYIDNKDVMLWIKPHLAHTYVQKCEVKMREHVVEFETAFYILAHIFVKQLRMKIIDKKY